MVGIGAITLTLALSYRNSQQIPARIKAQLESPALLPGANSGVRVDWASCKYDAANKVFSYDIKDRSGNVVVVAEQPTPGEFIDIPATYDKIISSLGIFLTFDSPVGVVSVGHPPTLPNGSEVGIARSDGTLMFVRTSRSWKEVQWRTFFNTLNVVR